MHREHFLDGHHPGVSRGAVVQRLDQLRIGRFTDQQALGLD